MNKVLPLIFTVVILTGSAFAQNPPPADTAAAVPVAVPIAVKPAHHEHHAEIHKAMRKLRDAKMDLGKAAHDFGGHKAKAIAAIDQALLELRAALDHDKN